MTQGNEVTAESTAATTEPAGTEAPAAGVESFTPTLEQRGIINRLSDAAWRGNLEGIEECITAWKNTGADVKHLPAAKDTYCGRTPLHFAAANGQVEVITALIQAAREAGANDEFILEMLTAKVGDGWAPLHDAAAYGKVDAALALLDLGLEVGGFEFVQNKMLKAQNNDGRTATDLARWRGNAYIVVAIENWLAEKQTAEIVQQIGELPLSEQAKEGLSKIFKIAGTAKGGGPDLIQKVAADLRRDLSGDAGGCSSGPRQ